MKRGLRAMAVGSLLLAGCAYRGEGPRLHPVCGPADAPAVMLEVPSGAGESPLFRLRVDGVVGGMAGRRVVVSNPDSAGPYADWCDAGGCVVLRSTTPTTAAFGPLRRDSSMTVDLRTTMPDGKPFTWRGVVPWHGERLVCG